MRTFLLTYSRLIIFAIGLLFGIQIPSFVDQYQKRVDAHFQEVSANIAGFQLTANDLFSGDLRALIAHYEQSNDQVFRRDAGSIRIIHDRYSRISAEHLVMEGNSFLVVMHVVFAADQELLGESVNQYTYTVPLNSIAIQWGLAIAVLLTLAIDFLFYCCVKCVGLMRRRNPSTNPA
ncbi:MAG TPA: DUF2937 family protein [Porticoccaceae bacterium]|jgi:hypothetical protein|nr:DUF2937 family protein [Gammaproteobacteria bacterium]HIL60688.1 DUF2937 family protein [Porticoccaceae bacterium]